MTLPELHRHVADHIAHAGQPATEFARGWDAAYINVSNALRGLPVETCLCAALLMPDGYIVRGHRHDDCYITIGFYRKPGTPDALYCTTRDSCTRPCRAS